MYNWDRDQQREGEDERGGGNGFHSVLCQSVLCGTAQAGIMNFLPFFQSAGMCHLGGIFVLFSL